MAGLPSTITRSEPTVACAAMGATSGSCGVQTGSVSYTHLTLPTKA